MVLYAPKQQNMAPDQHKVVTMHAECELYVDPIAIMRVQGTINANSAWHNMVLANPFAPKLPSAWLHDDQTPRKQQ